MTDETTQDSDEQPRTPTVEIVTEVPADDEEMFDDIEGLFREFFEAAIENGLDEMSDDAFMQVVMHSSTRLEMDGVPREERADWISAAARLAMLNTAEDNITEVEHTIQMLFQI